MRIGFFLFFFLTFFFSDSLLKEDIDDKMVGDFSKSHNKKDHRMMKGEDFFFFRI